MNLVCLGLSFHTAPVAVRERLAFSPARRRALHECLAGPDRPAGLFEAAILSTCNRTELHAVVDDVLAASPALVEILTAGAGGPRAAIVPHLYLHADAAAVRHLLRVAAGLDSMIVGEAEILGQVRRAIGEAREAAAAGTVLETLFTAAGRAGRRARAETDIGTRAASASSAAVQLARSAVGDLVGRNIVLVGAGKMGVLVARALVAEGARGFAVSNRSYGRAVELANAWDGCAVTFDRLTEVMIDADIVISSTSASHPVLRQADVAAVMARRPATPLTIIDIAVPRDVEPEAGEVPGVQLFDIDDLTRTIEGNLAGRSAAIPQVEAIVDAETERFTRWLATLEVTPTIAALRRWADAVGAQEVQRSLRRRGVVDARDRAMLETMAAAIIAKLMHPPIAQLRRHAGDPARYREIEMVREMFGLDQPGSAPPADLHEHEEEEELDAPANAGVRVNGMHA